MFELLQGQFDEEEEGEEKEDEEDKRELQEGQSSFRCFTAPAHLIQMRVVISLQQSAMTS